MTRAHTHKQTHTHAPPAESKRPRERCCRYLSPDTWREALERGVGERCWREVLERGVGERCWREVLERGVGERCWREVLEIPEP